MENKEIEYTKKRKSTGKLGPIKSNAVSKPDKKEEVKQEIRFDPLAKIRNRPTTTEEEQIINQAKVLFFRAGFFLKSNRIQAINLLERSIRLKPNYIDSLFLLGVLYSEFGRFDESLTMFEKILELEPLHQDANFNLANLYYRKKNFDKAIKIYELVTQLNPKAFDALFNIAYINFKHKRRYEKAEEIFKKILEMVPTHTKAKYTLGLNYYFMGDKSNSQKIFEELIRMVPEHPAPYYNLAQIYTETGQEDRAMMILEKYLPIAANNPEQANYYKKAKRRLREYREKFN